MKRHCDVCQQARDPQWCGFEDCPLRHLRNAGTKPAKASGYVTQVPDEHDRIVWRGRYYHLDTIAQSANAGGEAEEEYRSLLSVAHDLLDGQHDGSQQYEDMRGHTAEQIKDWLERHPKP